MTDTANKMADAIEGALARGDNIELGEKAWRFVVERLRAASEWRDISTAPRDGTIVDIWSGVRLPNCRWDSSSYAHDIPWGWGNSSFGRILNATHWMPIPAPPQRNEVKK